MDLCSKRVRRPFLRRLKKNIKVPRKCPSRFMTCVKKNETSIPAYNLYLPKVKQIYQSIFLGG